MKTITYAFSGGRNEKYNEDLIQAKEFFYGLPSFNKDDFEINIIEFKRDKNSLFLRFFDKIMTRVLSLPFYTSLIVNLKNYRIFKKTDYLILVNENIGCSVLPLLYALKFKKKTRSGMFVMGLYSKKIRYPFLKNIHFFIVKRVVSNIDNIFFLGKGEFNKALEIHPSLKDKFIYFPFSVDTDFWVKDTNLDLNKNNKVIFVGNDGNRDWELLLGIAKNMPDIQFIFVSKIPELQSINLPNVELYTGSWGDNNILDEDIRNLYSQSRLSIIPLRESTQPSGQSVALQSMSCGIPVVISSTSGFWDNDSFTNKENIIFQYENTLDGWIETIQSFYNNKIQLEKISSNASSIISKKFNLKVFNEQLNNVFSIK